MFDPSIILILAPHTDDGELGCGGSIAQFIATGKIVHYAAFSSCSKSLPPELPADTLVKECRDATAALGIAGENVRLFDFPVRSFPAHRQEILEEMVSLNKQLKPDLVMIPSSTDIHQDHECIHVEARRAFRNTSLLGYELPWNQQESMLDYFISLTGEQLAGKKAALKAYTSQLHRSYMQENFIHSLATVRGVQAGCMFAEAFETYRIIMK